jgi:parallel beta-helix repeat protein
MLIIKKKYLIEILIICVEVLSLSGCTKNNDGPISGEPIPVTTDKNTYSIAQGGITDHSNPATPNSIAWYFKTYGAEKTYLLATSGVNYQVNSTITVPGNSALRGKDAEGIFTILAAAGVDKKTMVSLSSGCTLQNLVIDGNREAGNVVATGSGVGIQIKNCTIQNSKNDYLDMDGNAYTLLVNANNSTNLLIESCVLKNAGTNPKINPMTNLSGGYAILMWSAKNAVVKNCDISYTSTCGINHTGSSTVTITGNRIANTGLNRQSAGPLADAITAYHNWNNTAPENFILSNNRITGSNNHAIHVSGNGITIENNTIGDYELSGIMVDDWRSIANGGGANDNEFSQNVTIKNNKIVDDPKSWVWQPGNSNRKVYVDRVNKNLILDYSVNLDATGVLLPGSTANYHFPTLFGIH